MSVFRLELGVFHFVIFSGYVWIRERLEEGKILRTKENFPQNNNDEQKNKYEIK